MTDIVNWGVLGAANFAQNHMAPAIHMARGARLAALATRSAPRAEGFRAFCPDLKIHDSYEALLADPGIEAVYVPLPNTLHVEWTRKCLEAGKHVLCEKPIAMKAGEIDDLIALRDRTGLMATEAYMIVHHPQWQRAREIVASGGIGRLAHVSAFFSYDNSDDPGNIRNRAETGGGGLPDIGVYIFGCTRYVTGQEPTDIAARIEFEQGVDTTAEITARFGEAGYAGMVSMRMFPRQEVTFHGSEGVLTVTCPFNANVFGQAELRLERAGMSVTTERFPGVDHYVLQVENFCRTLREGTAYPWSLEDARGTQAMIDAVFAAAR